MDMPVFGLDFEAYRESGPSLSGGEGRNGDSALISHWVLVCVWFICMFMWVCRYLVARNWCQVAASTVLCFPSMAAGDLRLRFTGLPKKPAVLSKPQSVFLKILLPLMKGVGPGGVTQAGGFGSGLGVVDGSRRELPEA